MDSATARVIIWRRGGDPGAQSAIDELYRRAVAPELGGRTDRLHYRPARLSAAERRELSARLSALRETLERLDVRVDGWGQHGYDEPLTVTYQGAGTVPADIVEGLQTFGPGTVVLERRPPRAAPLPGAALGSTTVRE